MKKLLLWILAAAFTRDVYAQQDSITFVHTKWETQKIAKGLIWKHYHFNKTLFDTTENINVLEINLHKKLKLTLGYEKQLLKPTSEFAKQAKAIAAINGSFFDVKNGGSVDMLKANGEVMSTNRLGKNSQRAIHQKAALVFYKGKLDIKKWDGTTNWERQLNGDVIETGPLLIHNNTAEILDTTAFVRLRHPRTAIAITRNRVLLITIDGRNKNSAGVNLYELSKILTWLKACDGINLDGGGSTTMWIARQPDNGVVNYPTDNKKWDHEGERKVANVILLTE